MSRASAGTSTFQFLDVDVDEKAKPEGLKKMEHEALFTIQEAQLKKVSINKIQQRPDISWTTTPQTFFPQRPLVRTSERRGLDEAARLRAPFQLFLSQKSCISIVFLNPERDVVFLAVFFHQVVSQLSSYAGHIEMMVHQFAWIEPHPTRPK